MVVRMIVCVLCALPLCACVCMYNIGDCERADLVCVKA